MQNQKNCSEVFIYKKSLLFNISLDSSVLEVILKFGNVLVIPALQIEKLIHIFLQNWYEVSGANDDRSVSRRKPWYDCHHDVLFNGPCCFPENRKCFLSHNLRIIVDLWALKRNSGCDEREMLIFLNQFPQLPVEQLWLKIKMGEKRQLKVSEIFLVLEKMVLIPKF